MPEDVQKRKTTGLRALKTFVAMRGLARIDQRTLAGRSLIAWKAELVAALGGTKSISPQKETLVDVAVRTKLYLDCLDGWLLGQRSIVNGRKKAVLPALRDRTALAESLQRTLTTLGLDRVEKLVSLEEIVAEIDAEAAEKEKQTESVPEDEPRA